MEQLINQHFNEMDQALHQHQQHHQVIQQQQPRQRHAGNAMALFPQQGEMRLSGEEQAWLDQEFDSIDMAMESDVEAASHTGSLWSDVEGGAEDDEDEESFVARLLASHPQLDEAEARWLFKQERSQRHGGGMEMG